MSAMTDSDHKPLMRSLGEFFGHIVKGIRTNPGNPRTDPPRDRGESTRTVVRKEVSEQPHGDFILRRRTIDEVEVRGRGDEPE